MSKGYLAKFNVVKKIDYSDYTVLTDTIGDEWYIRDGVLFHKDNRNRTGKVQFHRQREVESFHKALRYIKSHSSKVFNGKKCKMERLFSMI